MGDSGDPAGLGPAVCHAYRGRPGHRPDDLCGDRHCGGLGLCGNACAGCGLDPFLRIGRIVRRYDRGCPAGRSAVQRRGGAEASVRAVGADADCDGAVRDRVRPDGIAPACPLFLDKPGAQLCRTGKYGVAGVGWNNPRRPHPARKPAAAPRSGAAGRPACAGGTSRIRAFVAPAPDRTGSIASRRSRTSRPGIGQTRGA